MGLHGAAGGAKPGAEAAGRTEIEEARGDEPDSPRKSREKATEGRVRRENGLGHRAGG